MNTVLSDHLNKLKLKVQFDSQDEAHFQTGSAENNEESNLEDEINGLTGVLSNRTAVQFSIERAEVASQIKASQAIAQHNSEAETKMADFHQVEAFSRAADDIAQRIAAIIIQNHPSLSDQPRGHRCPFTMVTDRARRAKRIPLYFKAATFGEHGLSHRTRTQSIHLTTWLQHNLESKSNLP